MMNFSEILANTIRDNIEDSLDFFLENELVLSRKSTIKFQYARDTFLIAWSKRPALSYLIKPQEYFGGATPLNRFREVLDRGDYNVLLSDGSLIQLAYVIKNEEVVWHRLCFLPCPLAFDQEEIAYFNISEMFDVLGTDELLVRTKMVTPIRFDYNKYLSDKSHPNCHMTIGKNSCRLPVFGPLSVGHFITFIVEHFYSDETNYLLEDLPAPYYWKHTFSPSRPHQLFLETTR